MVKTKEKRNNKILIPKIQKGYYKSRWDKFLELGKKLNKLWKEKKTFLEILKEERTK